MKRTLLLFSFLILFTGYAFGQITFEPGYIIDNDGNRSEVLIKNIEWKNNPEFIVYKPSATAEEQQATIDDITEFGIGENVAYRRFDVAIDRSSTVLSNLSTSRAAELNEERLLLKIVVGDGAATLYEYESRGLIRFFYQVDEGEVEQLIYKPFKTSDEKVAYNNRFRQQLLTALNCGNMSAESIKNVDYNIRSLKKLFVRHNVCVDPAYTNPYQKVRERVFHMTIRPGLTSSALSTRSSSGPSIDFDREISWSLGLLFEYTLPFNKRKWSVIFEPTYHTYSTSADYEGEMVTIDYQSLDIPLGIRHYFFINDDSRVFVNAAVAASLEIDAEIAYPDRRLAMKNGVYTLIGAGFTYKKLSGELRYHLNHNVLTNYVYWSSDYNSTSLVIGYRLF